MNRFLNNLFEFDRPESMGTRIYLRLFELFTVVYSIIYAWKWGFYSLRISDVVVPLGLANYLDMELFFGNSVPLIIAGLITAVSVLAFFGRKIKWLYLVGIVLLHIQYVTRFSLGEIPHSSNLVGFSLLGLGIGCTFFRDPLKSLKFAFGLVIFFTGLGYTSAGLSKLLGTGINWADGYHLWLWISEKSTDILARHGTYEYTWLQEMALQNRLTATLILLVGWLTELIAFLLWWRKLRPYIFTLVIVMHVGIYYSMNIFFLSYMIELVIIGYPWNRLIDRLSATREESLPIPLQKFLLYR